MVSLLASDRASYPTHSVKDLPIFSSVKRHHSFSGPGYTSPFRAKLGTPRMPAICSSTLSITTSPPC